MAKSAFFISIAEEGERSEIELRTMNSDLAKSKEDEFMSFLRANSAKLRMNIPTPGAIRETIEFLAGSVPNWSEETSPEEFAKILVKRYPELRFEWAEADGEPNAENASDEPATEKQIAYLKVLGAPIPQILGIREASDLIEEWKNKVSAAQKRRLDFYRLEYDPGITREQANALIDRYKEQHPESEAAYQEWKAQNPQSPD